MSTLSWRALLSEAWRDCLSGTARVGILTVLATALVGGIICADAFSLRSLSVEAASFRAHLGRCASSKRKAASTGPLAMRCRESPGCVQEPFARSNPAVPARTPCLVATPVRSHAWNRLSPGDNNGRSDGNSAP